MVKKVDTDKKIAWTNLALKAGVLLVTIVLAWGVASADLALTKYRVSKLEDTLKELTRSTTQMSLDICEMKTLMKNAIEKKND